MPLISQISLTFNRYGEQEIDENGDISKPTPTTVSATGSLQPLRFGDRQLLSQQGKSSNDARIFYTKTALKNADPYLQTPADETVINGVVYQVFDAGDWTTNTSTLAHYKVILIRKEQGDD